MSEAVVHARRAAIDEAVAAVRARTAAAPEFGIIVGAGLDALAQEVHVDARVACEEIPHLPALTDAPHPPQLLFGTLAGRSVAVLTAHFHRYDGHTLQQGTFPVRVLHQLGARALIVADACASVNPLWAAGELMLIDDHINLLGDNPLVGPNLDELGPRFPDMSVAYDPQLRALAERVALELRIPLRRGVYAAVAGPSQETRAEYRMLRTVGADAVGMSIVPDVIVARHMAMPVLGMAVISALRLPDALTPLGMAEMMRVAQAAAPQLSHVVRGVLAAAAPA